MIERILAFSLKNRLLIILLGLGVIGAGAHRAHAAADRRVSRCVADARAGRDRIARPRTRRSREAHHLSRRSRDERHARASRRSSRSRRSASRRCPSTSATTSTSTSLGSSRSSGSRLRRSRFRRVSANRSSDRSRPGSGRCISTRSKDRVRARSSLRTLQDWIVKYNLRTVPGRDRGACRSAAT